MPRTARFFSAKVALVSLVLLLLGAMFGAYTAFRVVNEHVLSLKGAVLAAILLFAGVVIFIAAAFPTGCATCKRIFSEAGASFAGPAYDAIVAAIHNGSPSAIHGLVPIAGPGPEGRAVLELRYCASCRQVGQLRVYEEQERSNGDAVRFVRGTKHAPIPAEVVGVTIGLIKHRTPDAAL